MNAKSKALLFVVVLALTGVLGWTSRGSIGTVLTDTMDERLYEYSKL